MKTFRVMTRIAAVTAALFPLWISNLRADSGTPDPATRTRIDNAFGKLPLQFEANQGRQPAQVKFLSRGQDYTVFLTPDGATLSLRKVRRQVRIDKPGPPVFEPKVEAAADLRLRLEGGNREVKLTGTDPLPGAINYFIGKDRAKWHANVTAYATVRYEQVYPGIDLVFYGNQRQLEYDFVLAPGSTPDAIRLSVEGAERTSVDPATGDLVLHAAGEEIRFHKPALYQPAAEGAPRQEVDGRFHANNGKVTFEVASYDHTRTLVVDPVLAYSTFLGGSGEDYTSAITTDKAGNAYVAGYTCSTNFPTTSGSYRPTQPTHGGGTFCNDGEGSSGSDVFVSKLNAAGSALVYSTYLGGSYEDYPKSIAVDSAGDAYVAGGTVSFDFPVTDSSICAPVNVGIGNCAFEEQSSCQGGPAYSGSNFGSFIAKLNPAGSALLWSSFMGGTGNDTIAAMAIDGAGDVYVAANATSQPQQDTFCPGNPEINYTWPVTSSGYEGQPSQGWETAVHQAFTKISADGSTILYSTLFGAIYIAADATGTASATSLAVDSAGKAYIGGETTAPSFLSTPGAYQTVCAACLNGSRQDGFIVAFDPSQSGSASLLFGTFLGGNGASPSGAVCGNIEDGVYAIALDRSDDIYVTGSACSEDFPTVHGAYRRADPKATGCDTPNAFLAKLNSTGATLERSTFLNGTSCNGAALGYGVSVDSAGNAYVAGYTNDPTFPTVNPVQAGTSSAAFVSEFNPAESELLFSTGLGANGSDAAYGIHTDNYGNIYVVGVSYGASFPTTTGALQTTFGGGLDDGFATRIALTQADLAVTNSAPATVLTGTNLTYTTTVNNNGPNTAYSVTLANSVPRGTTFVSAATSDGTCNTPAVGATSGRVTCTAPSLANGIGFTVSMVVNVTVRSGHTLTDTASASSLVFDANTVNNAATATTTVN